ncbi:EpsG family protein [Arenibacter latericius]|uniref:EpsG family protein n=1 Tax=Arenibacter latericius TaxID=86104 RepID=UPI0003F67813|nr:EpsG family protein [Arenibacter latericius]
MRRKWQKEDQIDKGIKVILFLISPFIASLYSLGSIKTKSSYVIFFLFALFFGMSFTVPSGKTESNSYDGASYREKLDRYYYYGDNLYYTRLKEYIEFKEGHKDIYFDTIAFITTKITDNYHVMFMIFAIIFAYFALKSLQFLTTEAKFVTSYTCLILATIFLDNQIFNINGVRFWTATWVGVYSIFQIYRNNNKTYIFLAFCTPFIHGSFWIFIFVLIISFFNKSNNRTWIILFYTSFLISLVSIELVRFSTDFLPDFLKKMAETYTDEDYVIELKGRSNAYFYISQLFSYATKIYINVMVFLFIKNKNLISNNEKTAKLFSFLLVWMTFVNFVAPIPSLGGRFFTLGFPIIAYIWLINFKGVKYKKFLYMMPFVFAHKIYLLIILYSGVLSVDFYISSPFYLIYKHLIVS